MTTPIQAVQGIRAGHISLRHIRVTWDACLICVQPALLQRAESSRPLPDRPQAEFSRPNRPGTFIACLLPNLPTPLLARGPLAFQGKFGMSKLHFIGGEKGGVGKSLVSRILAQYLIDHETPFLGFDTDQSHGALMRFYRDYTAPAAIDRYDSLDAIVEAVIADPERRVLVDLAAQTQPFLMRWMDDSDLLGLSAEMGIELNYWHVMDAGQDSVDLLGQLLDRFEGRLPLVLVLNEVRGDRFELLQASGLRNRAESQGAQVISLRHLQDAAMQKIDGHSSSFWAAINNSDKSSNSLGILERQRVKSWLKRAYLELDRLSV